MSKLAVLAACLALLAAGAAARGLAPPEDAGAPADPASAGAAAAAPTAPPPLPRGIASIVSDGAVTAVTYDPPRGARAARRPPIINPSVDLTQRIDADLLGASAPAAQEAQTGFAPGAPSGPAGAPPAAAAASVMPMRYGASGLASTDSRLSADGKSFYNLAARTGRLVVAFQNGSTAVCNGALIGKGMVLTAAHCVSSFGKGTAGVAKNVTFYGKYDTSNTGVYAGSWVSRGILVPTPYLTGTDTCYSGVALGAVCNNDIALVWLSASSGMKAGSKLGWYGYGWEFFGAATPLTKWGFTAPKSAIVTQLGFAKCCDKQGIMQMSISSAYEWFSTTVNNAGKTLKTLIRGSAMTGSDGAPWIVNFGESAIAASGAVYEYGNAGTRNVIIGVTSWEDATNMVSGAVRLGANNEFPNSGYGGRGAGNIGYLMNYACDVGPWKAANATNADC